MNQPDYVQKHGSNILDIVHGGQSPLLDDPAENYLQASKLTREGLAWETPMIPILMESEDLQKTSMRSARRYDSRPFERFENVKEVSPTLKRALSERRSTFRFADQKLELGELASILETAFGTYPVTADQMRRNTPSGGALYPLDIFVVARDVSGLNRDSLYFYDPFRHGLSDLKTSVDMDFFRRSLLLPDEIKEIPAFLILSACIWRSRFKYGQRAYRFCCIESGHLAQNILTVATDIGLGSRIFGGFIDDEVVSILPDANGIDDVPMYVIGLGRRP